MTILEELSFREKSILASLLAVLLVYGGYFADLLAGTREYTLNAMLATSIGVIITLVIVEVVLHSVLAATDASAETPKDERDRAIGRRAAGLAYSVLSMGVVVVFVRLLVTGAVGAESRVYEATQFEIANLLLFVIVLSELVNYGAQLWFYRRGI